MYEIIIAAVLFVDAFVLFVLGAETLGYGKVKTAGIATFIGGFFQLINGLILIFLLNNAYDGFLVWIFAITFLYAGYIFTKEMATDALASALVMLGIFVAYYFVDMALAGYQIWLILMGSYVILYAIFVAFLNEKVSAKLTGWYTIAVSILTCLVPGMYYLSGNSFH